MSGWSLGALGVVTVVAAVFVVWVVGSGMTQRRKARALAAALRRYQRQRLPAGEWDEDSQAVVTGSGQSVSVAELVARVEGEGLAVRLEWKGEDEAGWHEVGGEEWPTGVLPRTE